jgi:hypothetical protein
MATSRSPYIVDSNVAAAYAQQFDGSPGRDCMEAFIPLFLSICRKHQFEVVLLLIKILSSRCTSTII